MKIRLDVLLMERGLAESRSQAQALIMAGQVRIEGQVELKPSTKVGEDAHIELDRGPKYVSRGGEKLEGAMKAFLWDVKGHVCADVGASTGGFTDCLLQNEAAKVYAIDVGYGILHWKLRNDPRVVSMERTNARFVEGLPEPVSRITVDASFISLKIILPVIRNWFGGAGGEVVALIKPQFEAGREEAARGDGVIHDALVHHRVLEEVLSAAEQEGFDIKGLIQSPLKGPKGNTEFLVWLAYPGGHAVDIGELIQGVIE